MPEASPPASVGVIAENRQPTTSTSNDEPSGGTTLETTATIEPSQTESEALRDGVLFEVARLPYEIRVRLADPILGGAATRVETPEGVWMVSEPDVDQVTERRVLGDPEGAYGRDFVYLSMYSEVLLLDAAESKILRAFPITPAGDPGALVVSPEAVYCHRAADGGEPDSMLCRIDRSTLTMTVRIFPGPGGSSFDQPDSWTPSHWIINDPIGVSITGELEVNGNLRVVSDDRTFSFDPVTLELLSQNSG